MVDMRRHLRRWLDNAVLRELGDRYEGIIANVVERTLRNRFTCTRELQPVIEFEDGLRLVPNITMRRTLIEFFGADTEGWIGRRVVVYRHRVERTDPDSGKVLERFEKRAMRPEADVAVMTARRRERICEPRTPRPVIRRSRKRSRLASLRMRFPGPGEAAGTGRGNGRRARKRRPDDRDRHQRADVGERAGQSVPSLDANR